MKFLSFFNFCALFLPSWIRIRIHTTKIKVDPDPQNYRFFRAGLSLESLKLLMELLETLVMLVACDSRTVRTAPS
jgi:hypothetical protein